MLLDMSKDYSNTIGRVTGIYGQRVDVMCGDLVVQAVVRGKLKCVDAAESLIAVGDFVEVHQRSMDIATIERILRRGAVISRPAVENEGVIQVIVANVDRMVIVASIAQPPLSAGLIDRFLVVAAKAMIHPLIVINKVDLADVRSIANKIAAWRRISDEVICASAHSGEGIDRLRKILEKGTSVVVGHSGVGKSSLLNRINPRLNLKIGMISSSTKRGKHITSRSNLFKIFPDGWVADTPGLKNLGLVGITRKNLHHYFPEFAPFEKDCRFDDCLHIREPNCGIKGALENQDPAIAEFRYRDYLSIYDSLDE
jgi:ribosome biogenesis GTPase